MVLTEGKAEDISLIKERFPIKLSFHISANLLRKNILFRQGLIFKILRISLHALVITEYILRFNYLRNQPLVITQTHSSFIFCARIKNLFSSRKVYYVTSNIVILKPNLNFDFQLITSNELTHSLFSKHTNSELLSKTRWKNISDFKSISVTIIYMQSFEEHTHIKHLSSEYYQEILSLIKNEVGLGRKIMLKTHPRSNYLPKSLKKFPIVKRELHNYKDALHLSSCSTLTYEMNLKGFKSTYYKSLVAEKAFRFQTSFKDLIDFYG